MVKPIIKARVIEVKMITQFLNWILSEGAIIFWALFLEFILCQRIRNLVVTARKIKTQAPTKTIKTHTSIKLI